MLTPADQVQQLTQQVEDLQRQVQTLTQQVQRLTLPDDWIAVPREASIEHLTSMAVRSDHGLGVPGYYDQAMFGNNISHDALLRVAIMNMRQLYEEATGQGFYRLPLPTQSQ